MNRILLSTAIAAVLGIAGCSKPPQSEGTAAEAPAAPAEPAAEAPPAAPAASTPTAIAPAPANEVFPAGPISLRRVTGCNLEGVGGQAYSGDGAALTLDRSPMVAVTGWVVDAEARTPAAGLSLVIETSDQNHRWQVDGLRATPRVDVASGNGLPAGVVDVGFEVQLDLSGLQPGGYHFFLVHDANGERVYCDNARAVVLE